MTIPVWLESWRMCALRDDPQERPTAMITVDETTVVMLSVPRNTPDAADRIGMRAMLIAATPVLVRDALMYEWIVHKMTGGWCPACTRSRPNHAPDCGRDAALREAGFEDQETRDAARLMLQRVRRL